jgi:arsenate reductase
MSLPGPTLLNLDFVFTVCDSAAGEVCPVWPGQPMTAHWGVPDPTTAQGTREQVEKVFRDVFFFMLDRRISLFLCLPLAALDRLIQKEIAIKHGLSTKETSVTACW